MPKYRILNYLSYTPTLKKVLSDIQTVAVIGCSSNSYRTSHHIAKYLQSAGIRIVPINPNETEVLGELCYNTVFDLPEDFEIDVIDIFRNKRYTEKMVKEIVKWSEESGKKPIIWTQLDVSTDKARAMAKKNGFEYVENRCLMVEHRKFTGDL